MLKKLVVWEYTGSTKIKPPLKTGAVYHNIVFFNYELTLDVVSVTVSSL